MVFVAAMPETIDMSESTGPKAEKPSQNVSESTGYIQADFVDENGKGRKRSFWRTLQGYVWDDPDKPAYEKKFLFKLDVFLLSYTCLGYFCKNLYVLVLFIVVVLSRNPLVLMAISNLSSCTETRPT